MSLRLKSHLLRNLAELMIVIRFVVVRVPGRAVLYEVRYPKPLGEFGI